MGIQGHVHWIRFCRRGDIEMSVWDNCGQVDEFNSTGRNAVSPSADDTCMVVKRWMADRAVIRVVSLIPDAIAAGMRKGFHLPEGITSRRAIGPSVAANVERYAPRTMKTGELPEAAGKYLLDWRKGRFDQLPNPSHYSVLRYRLEEFRGEAIHNGRWSRPSRFKRLDLTIDGPEQEDSDAGSEGPVDLPLELGES